MKRTEGRFCYGSYFRFEKIVPVNFLRLVYVTRRKMLSSFFFKWIHRTCSDWKIFFVQRGNIRRKWCIDVYFLLLQCILYTIFLLWLENNESREEMIFFELCESRARKNSCGYNFLTYFFTVLKKCVWFKFNPFILQCRKDTKNQYHEKRLFTTNTDNNLFKV